MSDRGAQSPPLNAVAGPSLRALTLRLREILESAEFAAEGQRMAALRRALHERAAGLTEAQIERLVEELRTRFPDRSFENQRSARAEGARNDALAREVVEQRAELADLRRQVEHYRRLFGDLQRAAAESLGQDPIATPDAVNRSPQADAQAGLIQIAALLLPFALAQDETARSVEETLGGAAGRDASRTLHALISGPARGATLNRSDLDAISQRLRHLQLMPAALLASAQQSWKGGTREILEHLDPKAAKVGLLKAPAALKQIQQEFEQFWNQFDRNLDHYFRTRFERSYRDKMEDGP